MVTMLLAVLAFGTFDLGRAMFTYIALQDGAQEGVLYGQFRPEDTGHIERRARESSTSPFDLTDSSAVGVAVSVGTPCAGHPISVTVSHTVMPVTPIVSAWFPTGFDLSATMTGEIVLDAPSC